jgi:hypothetical protein
VVGAGNHRHSLLESTRLSDGRIGGEKSSGEMNEHFDLFLQSAASIATAVLRSFFSEAARLDKK